MAWFRRDENDKTPDAIIYEESRFTFGGGIAAVLFAIFNFFVMPVVFASSNASAIQAAAIGTFWIAGSVALGVVVIVGRRRTYKVFDIAKQANRRDFEKLAGR
jgi:hypothetical protein